MPQPMIDKFKQSANARARQRHKKLYRLFARNGLCGATRSKNSASRFVSRPIWAHNINMGLASDRTRSRNLSGKAFGVTTSTSMPNKLFSLRRIAPISKSDVSGVGSIRISRSLPSRSVPCTTEPKTLGLRALWLSTIWTIA